MTNEVRLQKAIANSGVTSRRKAEELITDGRVSVNGKIITELGTKVTDNDKVEVDGVPLTKGEKVYSFYYKPCGEISTVEDDNNRRTVTSKFEGLNLRIYPVGRLDYDTSGILLLTNDGEFTQYMTHPKFEVSKTYRVKVDGILKRNQQKEMKNVKVQADMMSAPGRIELILDKKER